MFDRKSSDGGTPCNEEPKQLITFFSAPEMLQELRVKSRTFGGPKNWQCLISPPMDGTPSKDKRARFVAFPSGGA